MSIAEIQYPPEKSYIISLSAWYSAASSYCIVRACMRACMHGYTCVCVCVFVCVIFDTLTEHYINNSIYRSSRFQVPSSEVAKQLSRTVSVRRRDGKASHGTASLVALSLISISKICLKISFLKYSLECRYCTEIVFDSVQWRCFVMFLSHACTCTSSVN